MSELHQPAVPVSVESLERMGEKIIRLERERDELRARVAELEGALDWYVENDDVMEGDHWDEDNAFWIAGKRRAEGLLAKKEANHG